MPIRRITPCNVKGGSKHRVAKKREQNPEVQLPRYVFSFPIGEYEMIISDCYPLRTKHGDKVVISLEGEVKGEPFNGKKFFDGGRIIWRNSELGNLLIELETVDKNYYIHWNRLKAKKVKVIFDKAKDEIVFIRRILPLPTTESDEEQGETSEDYEDEAFAEDYEDDDDEE